MRLDEFDFNLPEELIALRPAKPRRASRLLVAPGADSTSIVDSSVERLAEYLNSGDIMVFNDTSVIPARLNGERHRETADGSGVAAIEATLLKRLDERTWRTLAKPGKRLKAGDRISFGETLKAEVGAKGEGGAVDLRFDLAGAELDTTILNTGAMPLPPYIASRRAPDEQDREDYQTIFAERPGAVAAPTASLHFDDTVMAALEAKGVLSARLTLHVGGGTFLPIKSETITDHAMHAEWGEITEEAAAAINAARAAGGRVIAAGTTALRLLESAVDQEGRIHPFCGETDIFIKPGHRFHSADGLMTNFHLPKSSLFVLVAAFMGLERMQALYAHAIEQRYRFYSYGDASLLIR